MGRGDAPTVYNKITSQGGGVGRGSRKVVEECFLVNSGIEGVIMDGGFL